MSNTRRQVQYGWNLSNPDFIRLFGERIFSDKHQTKDRTTCSFKYKSWRFNKYCKNCKPNLEHKIDELKDKEERDLVNE